MTKTAEDEAREMLDRMGVEGPGQYSSGELVELANLLAARDAFTRGDVLALRGDLHPDGRVTVRRIATKIETLIAPREAKETERMERETLANLKRKYPA